MSPVKYAVRIFPVSGPPAKWIIRQTILRGGRYVLDEQRERFVAPTDDAAIAQACRDAIAGRLTNGKHA